MTGVYAILHQPSGRAYIGSSVDIARRWRNHLSGLSKQNHGTIALLELWLRDGPGVFVFLVLEQCPRELLTEREQEWLDRQVDPLNTSRRTDCPMFDPAIAAKVSASKRGRSFSAEHRANLSVAHKGIPSPMRGRKNPKLSRVISSEERARISARLMGHPVSESSRAKMREAKKHLSAESRERIAAVQRGRLNIAVAVSNRRRIVSTETRQKMSESQHRRRMAEHNLSDPSKGD